MLAQKLPALCTSALTLLLFLGKGAFAAYDIENLDRGVVAIPQGDSVFISWRWLGHEVDNTHFHIYRNGKRITGSPLSGKTNFVDTSGSLTAKYAVAAVINGVEQPASAAVTPWHDIAKRIPLQRPSGGTTPDGVAFSYSPNDASVADLDGDGQYEIVLKWNPSNAKDNAHSGYTGNVYVDAYELDGRRLWRLDLGRNVRAGAHYTQFIVYDLDSDGRAEVALRTSDGSVDGQGKVIGDAKADYRNSKGYVLSGPEFLTIFNGETGAELASTAYVPARGSVSSWGDNYGNRVDRFLAGLAWLDGEKPSLIMARGYYTRAVIVAWDWRNARLTQRWVADSNNKAYADLAGQGAHSLSIADVDGDGKQEVIYGAATVDHDGSLMYSTGLGHGDALHVGDLIPNRPGIEVYMVHESPSQYGPYGSEMHDAASGEIIWGASGENSDVGRGVAMDVDPRHFGAEAWATRGGGIFSPKGSRISPTRPSRVNFGAWWDGDFGRELLDSNVIEKWNHKNSSGTTLLNGEKWLVTSNNGTKATPALSADILGDWREEVLWRASSNDALLLFTSNIESPHRLRTLMHDPQYRAAVAWQNVVYNQPPQPSFFLGFDMTPPPQLDLNPVGAKGLPSRVSLSAPVQSSAPTPVSSSPAAVPPPPPEASEVPSTTAATFPSTAPVSDARCSYRVTSDWDAGFIAMIRIENTGSEAIEAWQVSWHYSSSVRAASSWNTTLSGSNPYTASNAFWNARIEPGQYVEFGFQGAGGSAEIPQVTGEVCR